MGRTITLMTIIVVVLLALVWVDSAAQTPWQMGPNLMAGPGAWNGDRSGGHRSVWPTRDLNLSVDKVRANVEYWFTWQDNPRLKVGDVKEKDSDTIVADIVTKDNSLVQRFAVNRHTGRFEISED